MSVQGCHRPPILAFVQSDLFDPNLLTLLSPKDRVIAAFLNAICFHPDFRGQPKLKTVCKTFFVPRADKVIKEIETGKRTADSALNKAVFEYNPVLLCRLINGPFQFGLKAFSKAVKTAASGGDLRFLEILKPKMDGTGFETVMNIAVSNENLRLIKWLPNDLSPTRDLSLRVFKCRNWAEIAPYVFSKIRTSEMQSILPQWTTERISGGVRKMELFLKKTNALTTLSGDQWGEVLTYRHKKLETVRFIMDPINSIPVSFDTIRPEEIVRLLVYCLRMSRRREEIFPQVFSKIPPHKMGDFLAHCVRKLIEGGEWSQLEFLLQQPDVKNLLTEQVWYGVLTENSQIHRSNAFKLIKILIRREIPIPLYATADHWRGGFLSEAFQDPDWEIIVPPILAEINPEDMRDSLVDCAQELKYKTSSEAMALFLQHTDAKKLLTEKDWETILNKYLVVSLEVADLLINPGHEIPLSGQSLYPIVLRFINCMCWGRVERILVSERARDPDFLRGAAYLFGQEFYTDYLDKHFHRFDHRALFFRKTEGNLIPTRDYVSIIEHALEWNCFNILSSFVDCKIAMRATYIYNSRWGSEQTETHVVSTELLTKISKKCGQMMRLNLQKTVDKEIARRGPLWTKAAFSVRSRWAYEV